MAISTGEGLFYINFTEQLWFSLLLIAGQISSQKQCPRLRLNEVAFFHVSFDFITSRRQSFYLTVIL